MNFITIKSSETVAYELSELIKIQLINNKKVLWLISGGSSVDIAVKTRALLEITSESKLSIGLVDERFGETGHVNSNWQQLIDAGFNFKNVLSYPVLEGLDFNNTTLKYNETLSGLLNDADYSIGLLGIGIDGHTSGLLPNNEIMNSMQYVDNYEGPDYKRISTTPLFINKLDRIIVWAFGEPKWQAIKQMSKNGSENEIPARILQKAPSVTVYTDYKGD